MARTVGIILLIASALLIFVIARRYPFAGTVVLEFEEIWLWLVLAVTVLVAGIGGYLTFRRSAITPYD